MTVMASKQTEIDAKVAAVRLRFLDRLQERLLQIEALMLAIDERGPEDWLIEEIAARAHKTAGIAPTLGFTELGELAMKVETALSQDLDAAGWKTFRPMVDQLLDEMEAALDG